ncbi:MAG: hypothetical protein HQ596_03985 [Candidatus Saganbacteria bacterium]|nr:hypothetical protein [Candidatus Saganbacteria bacterium]
MYVPIVKGTVNGRVFTSFGTLKMFTQTPSTQGLIAALVTAKAARTHIHLTHQLRGERIDPASPPQDLTDATQTILDLAREVIQSPAFPNFPRPASFPDIARGDVVLGWHVKGTHAHIFIDTVPEEYHLFEFPSPGIRLIAQIVDITI